MNLFPERTYRSGRRFLVLAALISLLIHLAGGSLWALFHHAVIGSAGPGAVPDVPALSEAITIEHRTAASSKAVARAPKPVTAMRVAAPVVPPAPLPPRPKVARVAPAVPKIRRAAPVRIAMTRPSRRAPVVPPEPQSAEPAGGALSPDRLAALDAQFRSTISSAQRAVVAGPAQRGATSQAATIDRDAAAADLRNAQIMGGRPEEFRAMKLITGGGDCVPLQGPFPVGNLKGYYIRCTVRYSDAFSEQVSFPWPFTFPRGKDPFDDRDNPYGAMTFPGQDPAPGFTLPPNFALSRTVCAYYRGRCGAILDAEKKRGDYIKPP